MTATDTITLFHAPNSRSTGTLILLEELGAPYDLHVLNLQIGRAIGSRITSRSIQWARCRRSCIATRW